MKESIKNMKAYQAELPAEAVKAKYGLSHLARLSANESVYGPSPKVYQAIRATADDIWDTIQMVKLQSCEKQLLNMITWCLKVWYLVSALMN